MHRILSSSSFNGTSQPGFGKFIPIKSLQRNDADVHLIVLSAPSIAYPAQVDDPWYSAYRALEVTANGMGTAYFYKPDESGSPMGCKTQYQICVPSVHGRCSRLGGLSEKNVVEGLDNVSSQRHSWIRNAAFRDLHLVNVLVALREEALVAKSTAIEGQQTPLPNNQWKLDVER